ncbi:MAG: dimethylarginine dimethylaminohydrolase family protein [Gammaproteobacteria bacterium]
MTEQIAITRAISPAMANCELAYRERTELDIALARVQHHRYEATLAKLGCTIVSLPAEPALPDSVFVEDAAVVTDEIAAITRPGATSRRAETASIAAALKPWRRLVFIEAPGTLDGGDVLRIGRRLWVGLSGRSNEVGASQLAAALAPFDYRVQTVPVRGCLHLKSAAARVGPETLLINPDWVDKTFFDGLRFLETAPQEPHGANALYVGGAVVYPASCARTCERLERAGITVHNVDVSEIEKAEGGVTCCSLIFSAPDG